jgi:hypothetical protein
MCHAWRGEAALANRPGDRGGALDGQRAGPDKRLHIQAIHIILPPVPVPPKEHIRMPAQLYFEPRESLIFKERHNASITRCTQQPAHY